MKACKARILQLPTTTHPLGFKPVTARHRPTALTSDLTAVPRRLTLQGLRARPHKASSRG